MNGLTTFAGESVDVAALDERIGAMVRAGLREPFDLDIMAALSSLSGALMADRSAPPAFTALGYWLRKAALQSYQRQFEASLPPGALAAPRGLTFHLPPTNVDTIFVYSWALSLLVGNANLVRLPSNPNPAVQRLLPLITRTLAEHGLGDGNMFVSYAADDAVGPALSTLCDTRVIWGGDAKVLNISAQPMRPGGVTIPFPDRFSYAVLDVAAYEALSTEDRDKLAARAFNDIFLFDQMACSSSRIMFWRETSAGYRPSAEDFARRCAAFARSRDVETAAWTRNAKFLYAHQAALDLPVDAVEAMDPTLTSVFLPSHETVTRRVQGGGVLVHAPIRALSDISGFAIGRDQTLTHFGVEVAELAAFARSLKGRGLDRIVPIGDALQFERIWDGFDLLRSFSKLVVVR